MTYEKAKNNTSMIHAYSLKSEHYANVANVIAHYKNLAKTDKSLDESTRKRFEASTLKRSELKAANNVLRDKAYNLYYIVKNDIFHTSKLHKESNLYDLKLFKSSTKQVATKSVATDLSKIEAKIVKAEKKSKKAAIVEVEAIEQDNAQDALNALEAIADESSDDNANIATA